VRKTYQNEEIDMSQPAVPEQVSVALGELAGELREGLLVLAVGTGLQVMAAMVEEDVTAACGPKGRHDPGRSAVRHGHGAGSVSLGGRRVPVRRPACTWATSSASRTSGWMSTGFRTGSCRTRGGSAWAS
jgi:putative transposase